MTLDDRIRICTILFSVTTTKRLRQMKTIQINKRKCKRNKTKMFTFLVRKISIKNNNMNENLLDF